MQTNYVFAEDFSWKFNNGLPETRNESKELDRFASDVKKATNGGLDIKVYHGGSLGLKNNDVLRWLPTGAAEMGLVWANYLGRDAPALNAVYIQGSVGSSDEHIRAIPVLKEIYSAIRSQGGVCISDEVQTGFGRTGKMFALEQIKGLEQRHGRYI